MSPVQVVVQQRLAQLHGALGALHIAACQLGFRRGRRLGRRRSCSAVPLRRLLRWRPVAATVASKSDERFSSEDALEGAAAGMTHPLPQLLSELSVTAALSEPSSSLAAAAGGAARCAVAERVRRCGLSPLSSLSRSMNVVALFVLAPPAPSLAPCSHKKATTEWRCCVQQPKFLAGWTVQTGKRKAKGARPRWGSNPRPYD